MMVLTQSQRDTIESVRRDFDSLPEPQRKAAYEVLRIVAKMKWPNEDFSHKSCVATNDVP